MHTVRVRNPQNNSAIPALLLSLAEIALFAPPFWEEDLVVLSYFFAMTMDSIVQGGGDGVETVESESVKDEDAKPNPAIPEEDVNVEPPANNDNGDGVKGHKSVPPSQIKSFELQGDRLRRL